MRRRKVQPQCVDANILPFRPFYKSLSTHAHLSRLKGVSLREGGYIVLIVRGRELLLDPAKPFVKAFQGKIILCCVKLFIGSVREDVQEGFDSTGCLSTAGLAASGCMKRHARVVERVAAFVVAMIASCVGL